MDPVRAYCDNEIGEAEGDFNAALQVCERWAVCTEARSEANTMSEREPSPLEDQIGDPSTMKYLKLTRTQSILLLKLNAKV